MGQFYARRSFQPFTIRYSDGRITRVRTVAVTMPPTMGAAMRRMTSEPVPEPHMMGSSPTITVITVINFGRSRSSAPSTIASCSSCRVGSRFSAAARCRRSAQACSRYMIITTPVSAATPASAMKPTAAAMDRS